MSTFTARHEVTGVETSKTRRVKYAGDNFVSSNRDNNSLGRILTFISVPDVSHVIFTVEVSVVVNRNKNDELVSRLAKSSISK